VATYPETVARPSRATRTTPQEVAEVRLPGRRSELVVVTSLRVAWLVLPVALGPAVADALHDVSTGPRSLASIALWSLWAIGLTATLIPLPATLTALRLGAPAVALVAIWSAAVGDTALSTVPGLLMATVVAVAALSAPLADRFVDGASYGDERRFLLRAPGPVVLVLGPAATLVAISGMALGPVLLLDGRWVAGAVATGLGLPVAGLAIRALHRLSRRWIVLVPAGFVLHDYLALAEPTLLQRSGLLRIGAAPADTDALDLTQQARGLALEVICREPHDVLPASRGRSAGGRSVEVRSIDAFLCSPVRPDVVLAAAARRRLPVRRPATG